MVVRLLLLIMENFKPMYALNAIKCALEQALLVLGPEVFILSARAGVTVAQGASPGTRNWQVLLTANSPGTPGPLVDANFSDPVRFHRIQIGP